VDGGTAAADNAAARAPLPASTTTEEPICARCQSTDYDDSIAIDDDDDDDDEFKNNNDKQACRQPTQHTPTDDGDILTFVGLDGTRASQRQTHNSELRRRGTRRRHLPGSFLSTAAAVASSRGNTNSSSSSSSASSLSAEDKAQAALTELRLAGDAAVDTVALQMAATGAAAPLRSFQAFVRRGIAAAKGERERRDASIAQRAKAADKGVNNVYDAAAQRQRRRAVEREARAKAAVGETRERARTALDAVTR
jgi:hypothetical protein